MHHSKQKNGILWRFAVTKSISGPRELHFRQIWQTTSLLVMWRLSSLSTCDKVDSRPQHHITLSATFRIRLLPWVSGVVDAHAPTHATQAPGSASGLRAIGTCSPW